jgi:hypothetical protein
MADAPAAPNTYVLYEARKKIQPQSVKGRFRRIKWMLLGLTLAIYYLLPFLRWNRGPHEPSQAVMIDLATDASTSSSSSSGPRRCTTSPAF